MTQTPKNDKKQTVVVKYPESTQEKSTTNFKNGKLHGLATFYHKNGEKKGLVNFKDDERHGVQTCWHENGQKKGEVNYKNAEKNGIAVYWDDNGKKQKDGRYIDGKKDGLFTEYHENGEKKSQESWKDGVQQGTKPTPDAEQNSPLYPSLSLQKGSTEDNQKNSKENNPEIPDTNTKAAEITLAYFDGDHAFQDFLSALQARKNPTQKNNF